ncbi:MAG TPA: serine hydrolase [Candidatus Elarobacter sp.]|jgi:beta-lactamase class A
MNRRRAVAALAGIAFAPALAFAQSSGALIWYAARFDGTKHVESHADSVLPAASVIKLLVVLALIDAAQASGFGLTTQVLLTGADRVGGSDRFGAAPPGRYPAGDLIDAMLSLSDNTASNALLRAVGIARCNDVAAAHGLRSTRIRRRFYDWDAQRHGLENETTPRESAKLLLLIARAAARLRAGSAVARAAMRALLAQSDRETIPAALPKRRDVANKTGELPGIRNDVAIVGYGHPDAYVIAVLNRYGRGDRHAAIAAIRGVARTVDRRLA